MYRAPPGFGAVQPSTCAPTHSCCAPVLCFAVKQTRCGHWTTSLVAGKVVCAARGGVALADVDVGVANNRCCSRQVE